MQAPDKIKRLVDNFSEHNDQYKSSSYNETQVRRDYIDPFFSALGWDIDNKEGLAEAYRHVIHEDAIKIGRSTKAPDYGFRYGGQLKFFVEAKKPSVYIKGDPSPAYQVRRYAWSAKLPISILTDFEEFAVYDCRVKPDEKDKASTARVMYITFDQYLEKWDELYDRFSYDAIGKGRFDKYIESPKKKRGTAEVDDEFLKEIEAWREMLAKNIALRNPSLSIRDLNFAVQKTIDRIIFLRICEDRGIESMEQLRALQNGANIYQRLCQIFLNADNRYNSGLFHFDEEKGRSTPVDEMTLELKIDDKPLKEIFKHLYYPHSPYEFSVLPADILGQVYERFLGKTIRLTRGHQAKVEEKPEVKKAGGVYYTPTYIVDYIVKNTVGKLLEKKTPNQVEKLKILDPACGSGSFLIGAYQYLLDWHEKKYMESGGKTKKSKLYEVRDGEYRLTTAERKKILLNNIYGVDIDPQAVETTKLSLLLKTLEGESDQTLTAQMKLIKERALPDLGDNIKCGNSLIGPDFYDGEQSDLFLDEEERYRINAFDWEAEFTDIFKQGGFDAVIGNPPYIRQEMLTQFKPYFEKKYDVYHGVADIYVYFIEKGVSFLKENGQFGIIVANKWMRANYGEPLRRWMKAGRIEEIIDFGDMPVFQKATTYPYILRLSKDGKGKSFDVTQIKSLEFAELQEAVEEGRYEVEHGALNDNGWSLTDEKTRKLLEKLKTIGIPLGEYVDGKVYYGIKTGLNEAFVIDEKTRQNLIAEDPKSAELIKPFLAGRDIKRYKEPTSDKFLISIPKGWTNAQLKQKQNAWNCLKEAYPAIAKHLEPYTAKGEKRYDKGDYWWELRACDYYEEFEKPKIIFPDISTRGNFAYEANQSYLGNTAYIMPTDDISLLAQLNSCLMTFYYSHITSSIRGGYYRFIFQYVTQLPIRTIDFDSKDDVVKHDKMVTLVERMLDLNKKLDSANSPHDKTRIERDIAATDNQIDRLVYDLYNLTEEEIAIVEEATKQGK